MIAVSDTTAVTTLLQVGRVDLLTGLFGHVLIPPAVERELLKHHHALPSCCVVRRVADSERLRRLLTQADPGEAEAICLAIDATADILLIDDKKGRRLAEAEGVRCLGLPARVVGEPRDALGASSGEEGRRAPGPPSLALAMRTRSGTGFTVPISPDPPTSFRKSGAGWFTGGNRGEVGLGGDRRGKHCVVVGIAADGFGPGGNQPRPIAVGGR